MRQTNGSIGSIFIQLIASLSRPARINLLPSIEVLLSIMCQKMSVRRTATVSFFLIALGIGFGSSHAQDAPLFETRAVWFATVLGDGNWPESTSDSAVKQEADLRDRIRTAHSMGLNTFIMQVVARGDAMYESERLPWSARLKGAGVHPGYDPLFVAIDEAHELGMELHAWFNVYRVGDTGTVTAFSGLSDPGHVYYENPEWIENRSGALWLNPAFAEARDWLVGNVQEIVDNYDVDGIHFDFARYDQGGYIDDLDNFTQNQRGFTMIDDWRRNNVTLFIREAAAAIIGAKNWIKVSATPLGNYTPFEDAWPALWAYDDVFQESRLWLVEGSLDYLAPQIYFDIGREPEPPNSYDSPDFGFLIDEWVDEVQGRPIFAGLGPYKSVVYEELDTQIARSRTEGARGQVYFRYNHILPFDFETSYPTAALPWPMSHRFFAIAPNVPTGLALDAGTTGSGGPSYTISWQEPASNAMDPLGTYAIFRNEFEDPDVSNPGHLLRVVNRMQLSYTDESPQPGIEYRYRVSAISRLGIASPGSDVVGTGSVGVEDGVTLASELSIRSIYPNPSSGDITVTYTSSVGNPISFEVYDVIGRRMLFETADGLQAGEAERILRLSSLPTGTYLLQVSDKNVKVSRPFIKL